MGAVNNTDNLGTRLAVGDHVGYIHGITHQRIHSGVVKQLCPKMVYILPDDDFYLDAKYLDDYLDSDEFKVFHPKHKYSFKDKCCCVSYGKIVKLGY